MTSVVIVRNQGKTPAKDIDVTIKIPTVRCAPRTGPAQRDRPRWARTVRDSPKYFEAH